MRDLYSGWAGHYYTVISSLELHMYRKTSQVFRQGTNELQVIGEARSSFEASQPDYSLSGARAGWPMGPPSTGSKVSLNMALGG